MLWCLLLVALCAAASAERKTYEGYKLFHINPSTIEDVKYLRDLMTSVEYDFWTEPRGVGHQVDVLVPPQAVKQFVNLLSIRGVKFVVSKTDFSSQLSEQWKSIDSRPENYVFNLDDWNTLADINGWLAALPSSCKSGVTCQTYSIGNSVEGRPINAFKVSKTGTGRRVYLVDATTHAREWLSTGTILKIIDHVVNQYGVDADVTRLVDAFDWLFVPVVNPDGYQYTWDSDRLWRKNRVPSYEASGCIGVDLNRNFDFRWGTDGVSHLQCADTYCGPVGNSEPETQAVANEYARHASVSRALFTIHSYAQMWLWPWGNYIVGQPGQQCDLADDHQDLLDVGNAAADAVQNTYNTVWERGNSCEVIYAATGATDDYSKGALNIKYAFTAELRGNGFVVPADQIDPSFREVWNGLVAMDGAITAKHGVNFP